MPYDTGHLAHAAYFKRFYGADECILTINCADNQMGAPYAPSLNDGSVPHNIPHAFGRPLPFGMKGKFDGKFHPGSQKHKGFFDGPSENSILGYAINYFVRHYGAEVKNEPK